MKQLGTAFEFQGARTSNGVSKNQAREIGKKAFKTACLMKSISSVNLSSKDISEDFAAWFYSVGHEFLHFSCAEAEDLDVLGGDGGEDPVGFLDEEDPSKKSELLIVCGKEPPQLELDAHVVASLEFEATQEHGYQQAFETLPSVHGSSATQASPRDAGHESNSKSSADRYKKSRVDFHHTLSQMLSHRGLDNYSPKGADSVKEALQRLRSLCPSFQNFVAATRISEGFLSPSQVGHSKANLSDYHQTVKEIARAKTAMNLHGARQSRSQAWCTFAKLVAEKAQASVDSGILEKDVVAEEITHFTPSCVQQDGVRQYQVVTLRLHSCSNLVLGLVEQVFFRIL